jgi:hypothetical protein
MREYLKIYANICVRQYLHAEIRPCDTTLNYYNILLLLLLLLLFYYIIFNPQILHVYQNTFT